MSSQARSTYADFNVAKSADRLILRQSFASGAQRLPQDSGRKRDVARKDSLSSRTVREVQWHEEHM